MELQLEHTEIVSPQLKEEIGANTEFMLTHRQEALRWEVRAEAGLSPDPGCCVLFLMS